MTAGPSSFLKGKTLLGGSESVLPEGALFFIGVFGEPFLRNALAAGLLAGSVCAFLGAYVILRRIVFLGVALSEAAALGVALGLFVGWNPEATASGLTLLMALLFSLSGRYRVLSQESLIGWAYVVAAGVAIILTCFYQRQDQVLRDEAAVRAGVVSAARWVAAKGFAHVMLEIANEHSHGGFDHGIIKTGEGMAELVRLARKTVPGLLVSASGMGNGRAKREVAEASDFILIHFNGTPVVQIPERVKALGRYGKAVVCNEDDKTGKEGAAAAGAAVAAGCSWGLMLSAVNQYVPFEFNGSRDDPVIYAALKALTTSGR